MNAYERLEDEACRDGIDVIDCNFNSDSIKGLYCDGVIGINKNIKNMAEKTYCRIYSGRRRSKGKNQ